MLRQGGWVLIGIVLVAVIAWALIIWEWLQLRERTVGGWNSIARCVDDLQNGRPIDQAAIGSGNNFVASLLRSEVIQSPLDRRSFEAQVMPLLRSETVMLRRSLRVIAVLGATMPLLGLLGTVIGMIQTFGALMDYGVARVDALAGGISQALITTQAGLVIAVPVLLVNGLLASRSRRYLDTAGVMVKKIETAVCYETA
jgi:biopolymer transport protein ExbB